MWALCSPKTADSAIYAFICFACYRCSAEGAPGSLQTILFAFQKRPAWEAKSAGTQPGIQKLPRLFQVSISGPHGARRLMSQLFRAFEVYWSFFSSWSPKRPLKEVISDKNTNKNNRQGFEGRCLPKTPAPPNGNTLSLPSPPRRAFPLFLCKEVFCVMVTREWKKACLLE